MLHVALILMHTYNYSCNQENYGREKTVYESTNATFFQVIITAARINKWLEFYTQLLYLSKIGPLVECWSPPVLMK